MVPKATVFMEGTYVFCYSTPKARFLFGGENSALCEGQRAMSPLEKVTYYQGLLRQVTQVQASGYSRTFHLK